MCSGRVDLDFILEAFANGNDGVFVGGCRLDECNYTTHGNYDAYSVVEIAKRIMHHLGLDPGRLRIEFMSGSDGNLMAEILDSFSSQIRELGPLGSSEGLDGEKLKRKLEAARKLVPYIRLVERERLRIPVKSQKSYKAFFADPSTNQLFTKLVADKLTLSEIMLLLNEKDLATGELAGLLELDASSVARQVGEASRAGLISYDEERKCYTLS
jgi:coenzyme F420-reducing hydrogenase delta subunit